MSGIAQDELRKLSSRIKFGHSQSIKNGVVMGNSRLYGYDKQKGALVVNEAEADMVRLIFEHYATGDSSTAKIEKLLYAKGYRNYKGGKIDRGVINHIITNPKYMGYYCGNKVKVVDMFTKKQKFLSPDEWLMYKDEGKVPAIVSEPLWHRANEIFKARSEGIKSRRTSFKSGNLFTGKLICAEHGTPFWLKQHRTRSADDNLAWVCSHRIKNGAASCRTVSIREKELVSMLTGVLKELSGNTGGIVEKYLAYVEQVYAKSDAEKSIAGVDAAIEKLNKKKERLLELNLDGKLSNDEFATRNDQYNAEIGQLQGGKRELMKSRDSRSECIANIHNLKNELARYHNSENVELTTGIVGMFIDKIIVAGDGSGNLQLRIYLNTGNSITKTIGRCDDMSKNIFPKRHKKFYQKENMRNMPPAERECLNRV